MDSRTDSNFGTALFGTILFGTALIKIVGTRRRKVDAEKWTPQSRLPDFSRAGYHSGDDALPDVPVVKNLQSDFGAKGDEQTDDTQAFLVLH